ncbi:hypothetical protein COL27_25685 [Bacillus sp. AFS075960]|nr:hypothetical protein COL27_25685 [Bacillus sp. AFS075960]
MKMTYKNLNLNELKQSLNSLAPGKREFKVELSLHRDGPATLYTGVEVMSLDNILELVEKQGFKINDIDGVNSEGKMKKCIGISLNKPFIHEKTKENIEALFILGDALDQETKGILYSFLIRAEKTYSNFSRTINFSVDITAENIEDAKSCFYEKIASFKHLSKTGITLIPVTYDGEWVEMDPEEDEDEIRFHIEDLTLERIDKMFSTVDKVHEIFKEAESELYE